MDVPCFDGNWARTSFSTCDMFSIALTIPQTQQTNGNLEINKLLGECAHLVVEAERVLANLVRREDEVALTLLFAVQDDLLVGGLHNIVDIERTTGLHLDEKSARSAVPTLHSEEAHGEVEGDLFALLFGGGEEARVLVGADLVGQCRGGNIGDETGEQPGYQDR